jgi:SAM-dependent methyltransferase
MENVTDESLLRLDQWLMRSWDRTAPAYRWLFLQTLATTASRRRWIESWPPVVDGPVVDVGCGPGIVCHEIATLKSCRAIGFDRDPVVLDLARNLHRLLRLSDRVEFHESDVLVRDGTGGAAAACARFVAQYAPSLDLFFARIKSHVRSGGYVAIEDIDDGYLVEHPQPPLAWQHAVDAFREYQSGGEGDRYVGRKLADAGRRAGLEIDSIALNPSVQAAWTTWDDLSVQFDIERMRQALPLMMARRLITAGEWRTAEHAYQSSFPHFSYVSTSTVRILFRVP